MSFSQDVAREQALAPVLDKFYIKKQWEFNRQDDSSLQNKGVDGFLISKGLSIAIDEKAQVDYCNAFQISTLGFEVFYLKDGKPKLGWLFDPEKLTKGYGYVSAIKTKSGNKSYQPEDEVTGFEYYLINRQALSEFLLNHGINQKVCNEKLKEHQVSGRSKLDFFPGAKSSYSPRFEEKPQLILLSKKLLLDQSGICTKSIFEIDED